ncbi:MAG TPA: DLW-39 family protein [Mycobacteriales bacterium]|nr:DLW-39 family protein [Mycobacteriales bacterium]
MRRLLVLIAAIGAVASATKSWRTRKADAELWREATAPRP